MQDCVLLCASSVSPILKLQVFCSSGGHLRPSLCSSVAQSQRVKGSPEAAQLAARSLAWLAMPMSDLHKHPWMLQPLFQKQTGTKP